MSSREFSEWLAYERVEPFLGPRRDDLRAAIVACTVANAFRDAEQRPEPFRPEEFMPAATETRRTKKRKSAVELYATVKTWAMLAGAQRGTAE